MSFLGSLNCGDVLPFLFYSSSLWDSHDSFSYSFFPVKLILLNFLKGSFDWIGLVLQPHRAHSSVISCSNLLPDIPASPLPSYYPEHPFSFLSVIVPLNLGSTSRSYSWGPALEAGLSRSISGLLRMSPLLQTSLLQASCTYLHLEHAQTPPQCQFWLWLSGRVFPSTCPVCGSTACFYFPSTGSLFIHTQTHLCLCI